jgi:hypothetical protein
VKLVNFLLARRISRAVPGPHVPPSAGRAVVGGFLGTSGGTSMAAQAGGPALQLVSLLTGGTLCPVTWDSLGWCASRQ